MSNDNIYERLFKLFSMICKMIMDGSRDPKQVADILQKIVSVKIYLKQLFVGEATVVDATDGTETFASSGFFTGGIHGETLPVGGKATQPTNSAVHEIVEDGNFAQIFESLGENRSRWQESQVVKFCRDHRDKLRTDGYATFFELEGGFVARVAFDGDGRLNVYVYEFSHDYVWDAESRRRIVVPQQ